ncbi:SCO family protein [Paraburkholderia sp.]|uniref:SCO family protein n=1 Tax=Paraburkholderia sp. TaxID=1926495 RepID=UPI003C7B0984
MQTTVPVTHFSLVDHRGKQVTEENFKGNWLIVFFGFTNCPDVCPTSMERIAEAYRILNAESDRLTVLFITVDPSRDSPAVLANYVTAFNERFIGLTGTDAQVTAVTKEFGVYAKKGTPNQNGQYSIEHSTSFYLVDPHGRFNRSFSAETSAAQLATSLKKAMSTEND